MCAVRVVEPLNLGSPGMPSGHMTSPCVMTVPNSLLKVSDKHVEQNGEKWCSLLRVILYTPLQFFLRFKDKDFLRI